MGLGRWLKTFFLIWPDDCWVTSRDGHSNFVKKTLPDNLKRQSPIPSEFRDRVRVKLNSVRDKRYIRLNEKVKSFTNFFPVSKTMKITDSAESIDKICMVYGATKSGLNETVWAPWFFLPTVKSELRDIKADTVMYDCDVGEVFINFMMKTRLRPHAGVYLFQLYPEETVGKSK